jgi:flagellar basal body rod protein FlgC
MDPISTARYGMMAATRQLDVAATKIAGGFTGDDADYAVQAVNAVEARQAFKADVSVIKVADAMWQALLNLQAVTPARR